MFYWLSDFFRDPSVFPQPQMDELFLGMPVTLYDEFRTTRKAARSTSLAGRWGTATRPNPIGKATSSPRGKERSGAAR